jgi:hypothetical protein
MKCSNHVILFGDTKQQCVGELFMKVHGESQLLTKYHLSKTVALPQELGYSDS